MKNGWQWGRKPICKPLSGYVYFNSHSETRMEAGIVTSFKPIYFEVISIIPSIPEKICNFLQVKHANSRLQI